MENIRKINEEITEFNITIGNLSEKIRKTKQKILEDVEYHEKLYESIIDFQAKYPDEGYNLGTILNIITAKNTEIRCKGEVKNRGYVQLQTDIDETRKEYTLALEEAWDVHAKNSI